MIVSHHELILPRGVVRANAFVTRSERHAHCARRVVAQLDRFVQRPLVASIEQRAGLAGRTGEWAIGIADRYSRARRSADRTEMTLAPFAPAQRQISTARQGAPEWR